MRLAAWDYSGHRIVNHVALQSLPAEFPAFAREATNVERIAFLSGEPDRWRNVPDLIMKQSSGIWTDHFCDLEHIADAGIKPETVPSFRFDFVVQFAAGRAAHPHKFPAINATKNADHMREWPGFAPWAIAENYARLRSTFAYLKAFEELGTAGEIANAKANAVYVMGVMGHYVGDCAQPLHTTVHHNGWAGENPHAYTTWNGIHSRIDGGFIAKAGITLAEVAADTVPARPISLAARMDGREPLFVALIDYLIASHRLVEPLHAMDKAGAFKIEDGAAPTAAGRDFIAGRLRAGGEILGSIWLTAWKSAPPDIYLRARLLKRLEAAGRASANPK